MKRRRGEGGAAAFLLLFSLLLLFVESQGEREEKETSSQFASFRFLPLLLLWPLSFSFSFRVSSGSASFLSPSLGDYCTTRNSIQEESLRGDQSKDSPFDIPFPRNLDGGHFLLSCHFISKGASAAEGNEFVLMPMSPILRRTRERYCRCGGRRSLPSRQATKGTPRLGTILSLVEGRRTIAPFRRRRRRRRRHSANVPCTYVGAALPLLYAHAPLSLPPSPWPLAFPPIPEEDRFSNFYGNGPKKLNPTSNTFSFLWCRHIWFLW